MSPTRMAPPAAFLPGACAARRRTAAAVSPARARMRTCRVRALVCAALLTASASPLPAWSQALQLPAPPAARFAPTPGARLPLDVVLRDQAGVAAPLARQFERAPVVLVPVYYSCRNICTTLFQGVLQALALSGLKAGDYRLVGISVDPHDTPQAAAAMLPAYAALLPGGAADLSMLVGDAPALARVEAALGYEAVAVGGQSADGPELAHVAGFVVADTSGRVTRFFDGVRFDPAAVRAAVRDADQGQVDTDSFVKRIVLLCAHYAPSSGLHNAAAMAAVRAVALIVLLALAAWIWRRRTASARGGAA